MSQHIHVVALFSVQPDHIDAFVAAANEHLVAPAQGEDGCVRYELCQDVVDETRFAMIEEWTSEGALETHLRQPSLGDALDVLRPMVASGPEVRRFRTAG